MADMGDLNWSTHDKQRTLSDPLLLSSTPSPADSTLALACLSALKSRPK